MDGMQAIAQLCIILTCSQLRNCDALSKQMVGKTLMNRSMTKPTKWPVRPANSYQPEHSPSLINLRCAKDAVLLQTEIRPGGWPGWSSLRWAHRSFCWFCHVWAYLRMIIVVPYRHADKNYLFDTNKIEPPHDKTNKMACAPSEDSDQPGHPPSLIRVFAVRMKELAGVLSYPLSAQRRLWSD